MKMAGVIGKHMELGNTQKEEWFKEMMVMVSISSVCTVYAVYDKYHTHLGK
jgi:hypothetical protein